MRTSILRTTLMAVVAVVTFLPMSDSASAQERAGIVAVLDVAKVFKENRVFESKMQSIKATADQLKAQIQQKQEGIKREALGLNEYEVGSPERNQIEGVLEQKQAGLRTEARQAEMDLLSKEAKAYYETYQQMQTVLKSLSAQHGISLVLRFDSQEVDPTNRGEVIKGVNRTIVYQEKLDLTSLVIEKMSSEVAQSDGSTRR